MVDIPALEIINTNNYLREDIPLPRAIRILRDNPPRIGLNSEEILAAFR